MKIITIFFINSDMFLVWYNDDEGQLVRPFFIAGLLELNAGESCRENRNYPILSYVKHS
jgi:hypothetical protein